MQGAVDMDFVRTVSALSVFAAVSGCATYTSQTERIRRDWSAGNTSAAYAEVSECESDRRGSVDALVWKLERGAIARADGALQDSVKSFESAHADIAAFESAPEISISRETEAFLTNRSFLPYKGYNYDKIMACVYLALDYIELGDFDSARVQVKRIENYQAEAARQNAARIERERKALQDAADKRDAASVERARAVAERSEEFQKFYPDRSCGRAKRPYVNPFAYWVSGVFLAHAGEDMSDTERAQDMFRIGGSLAERQSSTFAQDYKMCENILSGGKIVPPTYVVFETGCAPIRRQFRLDLPLFVAGENLPHVAVNFPYLSARDSFKKSVAVSAGGKTHSLETVADMDEIIGLEFDNELPLVITKTLLSAAAKATAQYFAARAAGGDWGILVNIAGGVYQSLVNDADLRTWTTLPKKIMIARFDTPSDGIVKIDGAQANVRPDCANIVFVKSMSAGGKISVRTTAFAKNRGGANCGDAAEVSKKLAN